MSMLKWGGAATVLVLLGLALGQSSTGVAADKEATPAAAPSAGWIGVVLDEKSEGGALVKKVFPGGPAAGAGVRVGDKIVSVGDKKLTSPKMLIEAVEKSKPGSALTITVMRGDNEVQLAAIVGSLREFHESYIHEMMRRDPRDPNSAKFAGVSAKDMNAEMFRRLMEQNQRLEITMQAVLKEVQELRAEVKALKK